MPPVYYTRCWKCGERLKVVDDYGDYNVWEKNSDGKLVRKSEARWFDPDWVIARHIHKNH